MLTGTLPFGGANVSEVLAEVLKAEPHWEALPSGMSPVLAAFLRRCLVKDPKQRLHDVADVRLAMEGAFDTPVPQVAEAVVAPRLQVWHSPVPVVIAGIVVALLAGLVGWTVKPFPVSESIEFSIVAAPGATFGELIAYDGPEIDIAFSPDGDDIVYVGVQHGTSQPYRRPLRGVEATPIPGTEGAVAPFFSPDGQWLGFVDRESQALRRVRAIGGVAVGATDQTTWGV